MKKWPFIAFVRLALFFVSLKSQVPVRIDEHTPSSSIYFSWINHAWEGTDALQTMANLGFFRWMYDEYGMKLDLYLLDAGTLDEGPECIGRLFGENRYGSMDSKRFTEKFPEGLGPVSAMARSFGCSLGMWLGPDGYGASPGEAARRSSMLVSLCRDYGVELFKFDACCSDLREDHQENFINTMQECRKYNPGLIVLNHRISFSDEAKQHTTTWLWEGKETYVDVHYPCNITGTHHRTGTLSRGTVPGLQRLTEDHGVCISSCLDYWEDDLVLQAFNRNLILAPEIYGNPWLLNDHEFARLARIYNLHELYNTILVRGIALPADIYGENAVSRGNEKTRIITLRNLSWFPKTIALKLDSTIGLFGGGTIEVRQFHPVEKILGKFPSGSEIPVEVQPFRSCLLMLSRNPSPEPGITGADYEIVKNKTGEPVEISICGLPGKQYRVTLEQGINSYTKATLDGKPAHDLVLGNPIDIRFEGNGYTLPFHRKLADASVVQMPSDAEGLYEATCFAADNNALEVRSLTRSGPTLIPAVQQARNSFFTREAFIRKGIWDQYLFDHDTATRFVISPYLQAEDRVFRVDLGSAPHLDSLVLTGSETTSGITADYSMDLVNWKEAVTVQRHHQITLVFRRGATLRYVRIKDSPMSVAEINGYFNGRTVDRTGWRASNLFFSFCERHFSKAGQASFVLPDIAENSYLAIAINGKYEPESIYAALRIDGKLYGTPDRSVSFPSNTWEAPTATGTGNYTYYFPLDPGMKDKRIDVVIMGHDGLESLRTEVWITAYPIPYVRKKLVLE